MSLISDFLDSLTPENMIVASLGLADTWEDDLFGDLEVFELYGVSHTVSELKKKIKVNVKLTLPSELKKITSTFVVEGAQTIENEECEETVKDVKELSAQAVDLLSKLGYQGLIMRTDGIRVIQQNTPKYDSTSAGLVGNAVKQVKEKVRVLVIGS